MKLLADMGISPKTAAFLRGLGHDVVHLHEQGLDRLDDPAILAKARKEGRILLTHDLGFGELVAMSGSSLPSVVVLRLHDMRPHGVNRYLQAVLDQHREPLDRGAIISVTEGRIRLRVLPLNARE